MQEECRILTLVTQTRGKRSEYESLMYTVVKGKMWLVESGLLSNGGVGGNDEIGEGEPAKPATNVVHLRITWNLSSLA